MQIVRFLKGTLDVRPLSLTLLRQVYATSFGLVEAVMQ